MPTGFSAGLHNTDTLYLGCCPVLEALVLAPVGGAPMPAVSVGMPPTFVAAESVPRVLLGVVVGVSLAWLPPHEPSSSPPKSSAAGVK